MTVRAWFVLSLFGLACGDPETPVEAPVSIGGENVHDEEVDSVATPATDPRALVAGTTFSELVESVRTLDGRGGDQSSEACLLAPRGAGFRLSADLAASLRPLPSPPLGFDLADGGPVRVFSRWGQRGTGRPVLAAFTSSPPPRGGPVVVLFVSDATVTIRTTGGEVSATTSDLTTLASALGPAMALGPSSLFVTATRSTPVSRVVSVLRALPPEAATMVVLAVVLGDDTTLPDPPARGEGDSGMCSAAEPRSPGAGGTLDAAQARAALAPLQEASECLASASPESAMGGRITVEVVIGAAGQVAAACATTDEIGDSGVRTCLLDHIRRLAFPSPGGEVVLRFPVSLAPDRSEVQRALCD